MNPDAVHDSKTKHDHENKRAAVADQRQRHAGDRQQRNRHSDVLEDVRENERSDPDDEQQSELIAGKKSDEQTGQQQKRESADQKHPADESPLLADGGENVVVMNGRRRQKTELDLRVRRLEPFAGPAAGTDRNERLIDRPGRALLVDIGMNERRDALLLIRLQAKIYRDRNDGDARSGQCRSR